MSAIIDWFTDDSERADGTREGFGVIGPSDGDTYRLAIFVDRAGPNGELLTMAISLRDRTIVRWNHWPSIDTSGVEHLVEASTFDTDDRLVRTPLEAATGLADDAAPPLDETDRQLPGSLVDFVERLQRLPAEDPSTLEISPRDDIDRGDVAEALDELPASFVFEPEELDAADVRISPHLISASTYRIVDKASELADHPPIRRRLRGLCRHHVQYAHHDGAPERAALFAGLARSLDEQFPRSPLVHDMITRTADEPRRARDRYGIPLHRQGGDKLRTRLAEEHFEAFPEQLEDRGRARLDLVEFVFHLLESGLPEIVGPEKPYYRQYLMLASRLVDRIVEAPDRALDATQSRGLLEDLFDTELAPQIRRDRYLPAFADQLSEYLTVDVPASALQAPRADK